MQIVDHCQTAADVWAAVARVKAWRTSLKPPIRRVPIRCTERPTSIPIVRPKLRPSPGLCPAKFVQKTVAAHFNITVLDLGSRRRDAKTILARHVAIYVLRQISPMSLPEIGRRFGNRDHSTVFHALEKIGGLIAIDPDLKQTVETLIQECKP